MSGYQHIDSDGGAPIKAWTQGLPIEDGALKQLKNVAALPFIHSHVAAMPDVHWGMGATVGSVIPTVGAVIPAAVGVDIGCGMMAVKTSIRAEHLPDSLAGIRSDIEAAVPHGRTDNGGRNDIGAWAALERGYAAVVGKHPKAAHARGLGRLGTLGTGNHFIELCLDEDGAVWVMLHSGSRGQPLRELLHRAGQARDAPVVHQPARPGPRLLRRRQRGVHRRERAAQKWNRFCAESALECLDSGLDASSPEAAR